jgi:hypothetical protein
MPDPNSNNRPLVCCSELQLGMIWGHSIHRRPAYIMLSDEYALNFGKRPGEGKIWSLAVYDGVENVIVVWTSPWSNTCRIWPPDTLTLAEYERFQSTVYRMANRGVLLRSLCPRLYEPGGIPLLTQHT